MTPEPFWIEPNEAIAIHDLSIVQHGGLPGLRDRGLLESALGRPQNALAYGSPDMVDLAAAYAFGLANNHPFVDGNKRASLGVCLVFLEMNGFDLPAGPEVETAWQTLASGQMNEGELAAWLRERIVPMES